MLVRPAVPDHSVTYSTSHAGDWFEDWDQDNFKTPDWLSQYNYQKLYVKCEDWARKKRLESDTQGNAAMEIGGFDGENEKTWTGSSVWEVEGYVDDDGNWWSEEQWNQWEYEQASEDAEDVNAVNKGKGKGKWGQVLQVRPVWSHCR